MLRIWERKFGTLINKDHWNSIHQFKETRLRVLCWKIAHNIYPTNILLQKMKIASSNKCSHCNVTDCVEHFFFNCEKVKPLWDEIVKDIKSYMGITLILTEENILLGFQKISGVSKKRLSKINHAIAIGKMVITKFKYGKQRNIIEIYAIDSRTRHLWSQF